MKDWRLYERFVAGLMADSASDDLTVIPNAKLIGCISGVERQIDVLVDPLDEQRALWLKPLIEMAWTFAPVGSGFGFRADPFSGLPALHTGLDFAAEPGAPILAAAAGMVVGVETHPSYGRVLEIDHGNGLSTRYAHTSSVEVAAGALVKRGQLVALVGNSGRSTGPHLHFEVLLDGVPQDPARFLAGASLPPPPPERGASPDRRAAAARQFSGR